ncbi:MAG: oligoendopeptidase F, partial [Acetomicrobium sp.]|nr:oligoendopeptidase F [Acetomicrobium sp.]
MSEMKSVSVPERDEIAEEYKWRLEDLYPDFYAWENELHRLEKVMKKLKEATESLTSSAKSLLCGLKLRDEVAECLGRLYAYASFRSHEDVRDFKAQAMVQRASLMYLRFSEAVSSFVPSILELGKDKIDEFLSKEPGLDLYKTELARIMRLEGHVLSHEEERLLAMSTDMARVPGNVFSLLT